MALRIFLGLSALVWLPYGLFCLVNPGFLADAVGVSATSGTGSAELRAMYGGLQAGIGALALAGMLNEGVARHALVTLGTLCGGLAVARLTGAILDDGFSAYTYTGLVLELASVAAAIWLLRRSPSPVAL